MCLCGLFLAGERLESYRSTALGTGIRGQRSDVRCQRSKVKGQRSKVEGGTWNLEPGTWSRESLK